MAVADIAGRAAGYALPGERVDGQDVAEVYDATRRAVDRAWAGERPTLLECVTMRMHGQAEHPAGYVPKELIAQWQERDPVVLFERRLLDAGYLGGAEAERIKDETRQAVIAEMKAAHEMPLPDPTTMERVSMPTDAQRPAQENGEVTYIDAITQALRAETAADPDGFIIGEDVGVFGGAFNGTNGLIDEFGPIRVADTADRRMRVHRVGGRRRAVGRPASGGVPVSERNWEPEKAQEEIAQLTQAVKAQAIELAVVDPLMSSESRLGLTGPLPARLPADVKELVLKTVDEAVAAPLRHTWACGLWGRAGVGLAVVLPTRSGCSRPRSAATVTSTQGHPCPVAGLAGVEAERVWIYDATHSAGPAGWRSPSSTWCPASGSATSFPSRRPPPRSKSSSSRRSSPKGLTPW
ncbi:MAG: thiamine pyrophosphate-dependent enzyme [Actinomycetota bacterium]